MESSFPHPPMRHSLGDRHVVGLGHPDQLTPFDLLSADVQAHILEPGGADATRRLEPAATVVRTEDEVREILERGQSLISREMDE
jgi:hypothetical protein